MSDGREAAEILAQYAVGLKYEKIPALLRESTKRSILDTLGVAIAASTRGEGYKDLIELIQEGGGKEESTLFGVWTKAPAWMAAFANGAMARALMYDDTHDEAHTHPSSTTVPAAFAVAERLGKVSGKELIAAIVAGNELICRMGVSVCRSSFGRKMDWCLLNVHGVFGAAAACGRLLGLDAVRMQNALGIALEQSAGTMEAYSPGFAAMMTGMASGFTAKAGVLSSLLAEKGITGARNSLEGKAGLFNVHFRGNYDRKVLIADTDKRFESAGIGIKPWPGVRFTHGYIEATLKLMREHKISSEQISRIIVFVSGTARTLCEPLEVHRQPATCQDANRSLPYLLAVAATKGRIQIKDVAPEALKDPATLDFARRIVSSVDEGFNKTNRMGPGKVTIELASGKSCSKQIDFAYGDPQNPISWKDLTDKFLDCVSYSAKPISNQNIERIIDRVTHLEEVEDVTALFRSLG
jgi:2-methylcitrate dehydratase PrpD